MTSLPTPPIQSPPFALITTSFLMPQNSISVLYQSSGDNTVWMATSEDGVNWTQLSQLPPQVTIISAVAATTFNEAGTAYILYDSSAHDGTLWTAASSNNNWNPAQLPNSITTVASPAMALNNADDSLIAVYLNTLEPNNPAPLSLTTYSLTDPDPSWSPPAPVGDPSVVVSLCTPAIAVMNGTIYVVYKTGLKLRAITSSDGKTWSTPVVLPGFTNCTPALVVYGNTLWVVALAPTGTIWTTTSTDGQTWTSTLSAPGYMTSRYSPTAVVMNGRLFIAFASSTDNTIWMTTTTDAVNWTGPLQLPPAGITFGIGG